MALPETSEADKRSDPQKGPDKKEKLLTKVIIRRLPPSMDSDTFLNQISPVANYDYFYMVKGDASLGENSFARAYINFTNPLDVYNFKEKFDNYVFLDSGGHEYPAVVEFAAFQKIPKRRNKVRVDPKIGSIESDPCYLEFVEMLNKPPEQEEKPEYTYQLTEPKNDANESTPLLEYVKNKRVEKMRIREERREERKRKEFEKKKFREDERRKRFEERSPIKGKSPYTKVSPKEKNNENKETEKTKPEENEKTGKVEEKTEKEEFDNKYDKPTSSTSYYKNRDKNKYEDRKKDVKNKYPPKKDFIEKREYKRRDDYRERDYRTNKYEEYKKEDPKVYQKKAKKYTEKREERKIEAQKAEQKKLEQQQEGTSKEDTTKSLKEEKSSENFAKKDERHSPKKEQNREFKESKSRDSDNQKQGRIRNKDRPTIAIYRPGMLSKRKQTESDTETKKE